MNPRVALLIGLVTWAVAMSFGPAEIVAGKARARANGRTGATLALFFAAAVLVLHGLPRRRDDA